MEGGLLLLVQGVKAAGVGLDRRQQLTQSEGAGLFRVFKSLVELLVVRGRQQPSLLVQHLRNFSLSPRMHTSRHDTHTAHNAQWRNTRE